MAYHTLKFEHKLTLIAPKIVILSYCSNFEQIPL
jgi:hypothetical protein